jgi:hypothetical protein
MEDDVCNSSFSSEETHDAIFGIKLGSSSLSCLTNFIAILVIGCGGSYKKLIIRSVLYLLIADLLLVLVQVLELIPATYVNGHVGVRSGWENVCSMLGFFDQVTAWTRVLVVIFIVVQLFTIVRRPVDFPKAQSEYSKRIEAISICLCFLIPFTFNWIPFLNNYYGLSGHWCWIKLVVKECDDQSVMEGFIYMMILYYCPLMLIALITSALCLYMAYKWCIDDNKDLSIILVILYPIVFDALCFIMFINRVDSAVRIGKGETPYYSLWVVHSIADSVRTLLPSLAVIFLLSCRTSRLVLLPVLLPVPKKAAKEGEDQANEKTPLVEDHHEDSC